jgi:hypothetical protein
MNWSRPADLKAQLLRLWERGDLLADVVAGVGRFPLRLALRTPSSAEITSQFGELRSWVGELGALAPVRLEWDEVRHRVHGTQRLPASAWVDSLDEALKWIGKRRDWERFAELVRRTRESEPALLPWLQRRPLQALEYADRWDKLLALVAWLKLNPRPGIYLRQVDLPGIDSKFIEQHRGVLAELFNLALPAAAIDPARIGAGQFAARFGFLEKPQRIRFRVLDPTLAPMSGLHCPDVALDSESFRRAGDALAQARRVFITENEINFLAFPAVESSIVIFGAGYGWDALSKVEWLRTRDVMYWGDIDTHGFAILDQLRAHFPHVASFLMDEETLTAHRSSWGQEDAPGRPTLARLTAPEAALYSALCDDTLGHAVRLEQERIGFHWLEERLKISLG